ncbi:hypothetical protein FOZ63_000395 [Perkinsus olseni]|uniref:Uncharacterized protein n=1 Tax=Perkinsus olseni TaxID=32597 RepID=A0A7J6T2F1_PEROL|nr:hypothetical protein FOZ63_000395 [Perkinsus olseni]
MLLVHIFLVPTLVIATDAVRKDTDQCMEPVPRFNLTTVAMKPPQCLPYHGQPPSGSPDYCLYSRANKTFTNTGLLFLPYNTTQTPKKDPVALEGFVILSEKSRIPVDVGIRGAGETNFKLNLPMNGSDKDRILVDLDLDVPPCLKLGGRPAPDVEVSIPVQLRTQTNISGYEPLNAVGHGNATGHVATDEVFSYFHCLVAAFNNRGGLSSRITLWIAFYTTDLIRWNYQAYLDMEMDVNRQPVYNNYDFELFSADLDTES